MTTPINLGSYLINVPTDVEKTTIRDGLGIKSAALLNASFLNSNTLVISDPNNSLNTISIDKTLLGSSIADRLRTPRTFNITGDVSTSPVPSFDGTANISLAVTIGSGTISETKLATDAVVAAKIKDGEITPAKLSGGGPIWASGTTTLQRSLSLGAVGTDAESSVNFYSSVDVVSGGNARIVRASGVNGSLTISNAGGGNIVIRGLTAQSDNTLVSSRQLVGALEITASQINGTYSATALDSGVAVNYENIDSSTTNFLDTTIYDGKRAVVSQFTGSSKTFETFGSIRATRNSQTTADTAALQARSETGNVAVLLNADGATGASLVHVRNTPGLQVKLSNLSTDAPLRAGTITTSDDIIINQDQPQIIFQDTDHRSGFIQVDDNTFSIKGGAVNATTPTQVDSKWPLEINLANNAASFGGTVSASTPTASTHLATKAYVDSTLTIATAQASTSGTAIDFTGIPATAKRITIIFNGVSTNGSSRIAVQLGTAAGPKTSGYTSFCGYISSVNTHEVNSVTNGFGWWHANASDTQYGHMTITNISANNWISSHSGGFTNNQSQQFSISGGGSVSLAGVLDRIRVTTVNGTDTFDAGSINIMYE
jgi:hypothetical protein